MKNSILLVHAHIIADGNKEILDGAIAFKDTIEEVYYHINDKILKKYEGRIYDLEGLIIMPSFVNISHHISLGLYDDGTDVKYQNRILIHRTSKVESNHDYLIAPMNSELDRYDVILDLFHNGESFDYKKPTLINAAFNNRSYVSIMIDDIHDDVLDFIFRIIDRHKLIITTDMSKQDLIKRLLSQHISLMDMALYCGINLLRLLGYHKGGELKRGMDASFDIYDKDMQLICHIKHGLRKEGEDK